MNISISEWIKSTFGADEPDSYTLKIYDSSDSQNPIAEETIDADNYNSNYVSNKYSSKAPKYKHTFKKNDAGEYYWYSSEPYTE